MNIPSLLQLRCTRGALCKKITYSISTDRWSEEALTGLLDAIAVMRDDAYLAAKILYAVAGVTHQLENSENVRAYIKVCRGVALLEMRRMPHWTLDQYASRLNRSLHSLSELTAKHYPMAAIETDPDRKLFAQYYSNDPERWEECVCQ